MARGACPGSSLAVCRVKRCLSQTLQHAQHPWLSCCCRAHHTSTPTCSSSSPHLSLTTLPPVPCPRPAALGDPTTFNNLINRSSYRRSPSFDGHRNGWGPEAAQPTSPPAANDSPLPATKGWVLEHRHNPILPGLPPAWPMALCSPAEGPPLMHMVLLVQGCWALAQLLCP